jgi:phosphatidate phosphatase PAH1
VGVQTFKTQVLKDLMASHGAKIRAGHGNAVTDIGAYKAAGIPTADLYIIGPHGGEQGSTKVDSYTKLISGLAKYPGAAQP